MGGNRKKSKMKQRNQESEFLGRSEGEDLREYSFCCNIFS